MSDNSQEFKLLITGDATSAVDAFKQTGKASENLKDDTGDLSKEMGVVNVSQEDVAAATKGAGEAAHEAGEKFGGFSLKGREGREVFAKLNEMISGLGLALRGLGLGAEEAGAGVAAGEEQVAAANKSLIASSGPLVVIVLAIQAAMEYWDMYKDKVKSAAEAQEAATKRILDSVHEARKAVEELEEAMHPKKKDTAGADEAALKKQQQDLENAYNRQKELNKANKTKETAGAGSDAEKEQIQKRFEILDAQLEDWRAKQKAAIEGAMTGTMEKQLADLKAANDKLIEKSTKEFQVAKDAVGTSKQDEAQNKYEATKNELQKNADEAKAIRDKLDDLTGEQQTDKGNADFNSETNRQKFGVEGVNYQKPNAGNIVPSPDTQRDEAANKFATGKSIADTAASGGKVNESQQQFLTVLEQTLTGHKLTFDQAVQLMQVQSRHTSQAVGMLDGILSVNAALDSRLRSLERKFREIGYHGK